MVEDDRGQALTLEAVSGALLLLVAIGFALQMTAVTPLSASTSSQHLENQLQSTGEGVLASTAEIGALKTAVLNWNETEEQFQGAGEEEYYRNGSLGNAFGDALNRTYGDRNIAYNVYVHYQTAAGGTETQQMVFQGEPTDHAVSASRTVALLDSNNLTSAGDNPALSDAGAFYAPDTADDDPLYNLVVVEVVAWRI
jgi:hypothetical protein